MRAAVADCLRAWVDYTRQVQTANTPALRIAYGLGLITLTAKPLTLMPWLRIAYGLGLITLRTHPDRPPTSVRIAYGLVLITLPVSCLSDAAPLRIAYGLGLITLEKWTRCLETCCGLLTGLG